MSKQEKIPERVMDALRWHNCKERELLEYLAQSVDDMKLIQKFVLEGLATDGAHHKQWYLCQIGLIAGLKIDWSNLSAVAP